MGVPAGKIDEYFRQQREMQERLQKQLEAAQMQRAVQQQLDAMRQMSGQTFTVTQPYTTTLAPAYIGPETHDPYVAPEPERVEKRMADMTLDDFRRGVAKTWRGLPV